MKKVFTGILVLAILGWALTSFAAAKKIQKSSFLAQLSQAMENLLGGGQESTTTSPEGQTMMPGMPGGEGTVTPAPEKVMMPSQEEPQPMPKPAPVEERRGEEMMKWVEKEEFEEFVDPREVQQVLREFKDMKRELKRFSKQLKKLQNTGNDLIQIENLSAQIQNYEAAIKQGSNLRETIQDFRDAQIWEEINKFRAKMEVPKEVKQWSKDVKRLERLLNQKSFQKLGFDLTKARERVEEIKTGLAKIQEYYNGGDLESAIEELDELRQSGHPGEIMSVLQRMRDLMNRLKRVRNQELKDQITESLQEVIAAFDEGDFQLARELMDEYFNEIMQLIAKAYYVGTKKGFTQEDFIEMMDRLEEKIRGRSEERKGEMELRKEEMMQKPTEIVPQQPIEQPVPPPTEPTATTPSTVETPAPVE